MPNAPAGRADPQASEPQGITRRAEGPAQQPQPRQADERDESSDSQAAGQPSQRQMGKIAQQDLERGLVDTDKGPVIDKTYQQTRETSANPERKLRR